MAKSTTVKNKQKEVIDQLAIEVVQLVEDFAISELHKILENSDGSKVYSFRPDELFLGRYVISKNKETTYWEVTNFDGDFKNQFTSRQAALHYAHARMQGHYQKSSDIAMGDYAVGKYTDEVNFYAFKMKQPGLDEFHRELLTAKYTNSKVLLKHYKEELKKTLRSAKYIKLGT